MLRPYKGKEKDRRARASLRFWAGVFIMAGRITTFMPSAAIGAAWFRSAGAMTKGAVNSAERFAAPRAAGWWPGWAGTLSGGALFDFSPPMWPTAENTSL